MANKKISELPSVVTPALTDQFPVNQSGTTKKLTLQQLAGAAGNFAPNGTSRITVNSTTELALGVGVIPLFVNSLWQMRAITSPVTISNGGLSANTVYRVYAFDNAGTTTLELSTTARATDSAYGVEIKSGDSTRTLVGMIRANASSQFVDSADQRFAISWFNRRNIAGGAALGSGRSTASASLVELSSSDRKEFLVWGDEPAIQVSWTTLGSTDSAANATVNIAAGLDGTASFPTGGFSETIGGSYGMGGGYATTTTDGYHYITMMASTNSGTFTNGAGSGLFVLFRG